MRTVIAVILLTLTGCAGEKSPQRAEDLLPGWNDAPARSNITDFVRVLTPQP
jgi:hypothetical protein